MTTLPFHCREFARDVRVLQNIMLNLIGCPMSGIANRRMSTRLVQRARSNKLLMSDRLHLIGAILWKYK